MSGSIEADKYLLDCDTYADYLDLFSTLQDYHYLRHSHIRHQIVTLGHRVSKVLTPQEFEDRKQYVSLTLYPIQKTWKLFSLKIPISDPFLKAMALRERPNAQNMLSTIIWLEYQRANGQEISGYIDFKQSLTDANNNERNHLDWFAIFKGEKMLRPRKTDLSYSNWQKHFIIHNDSKNYKIMHDGELGVLFMHKGDHKTICVDINQPLHKENCYREMVYSRKYGYVTFYDHIVRRKF
ncbi:cilia- and flagella-associated protein 299-like [Teleopsis dalmanni]|uniref:cilia- and flagella-associated protein 299-like n=1 Tax=Teleopsis dalmanni TaxID=139649 RepID=UPI0018CCBAF1|nr:cilia- and flagella-associated protein 299-like [Teleopsis dalmanni]